MSQEATGSNRLARESSPYLRQHASNPVDWYPWGEEALARAREEDLPILLSIGYSACHWCHVMERESFADPATAEQMNANFVCIKVDREERPDVDALYMQAVQQMMGHGGWPLTVFLTPRGEPFFGGTYYPPEPRHGMPSFRQLLQGVRRAFDERPDEVARSAAELREALDAAARTGSGAGAMDPRLPERAEAAVLARADRRHGGFGGAPKFPQPLVLEFLLRRWAGGGSPAALETVVHNLRAMASGGLRDHLAGGFHRYSVDAYWRVPHFEKMLYDNAQLARVYALAHHATGDAELREVAEETLAYVLAYMTDPAGGFHAAEDADSEGEEGRFYLWSVAEVEEILGAEAPLFRAAYGVRPEGDLDGLTVLHRARSAGQLAAEGHGSEKDVAERLAAARRRLLEVRERRERPARDGKVIAAWNGMMIRALADAAWTLDEPAHAHAAARAADFVLDGLFVNGRLHRIHMDGRPSIPGFLEDHAHLGLGLLALYRATFELRWAVEARRLAELILAHFWDEEAGLLYDTAAGETELVVRPRDLFDAATPAGGSAAAELLLTLASLTGESRFERVATRVLASVAELAERAPLGLAAALSAAERLHAGGHELVVVGDPQEAGVRELLRAAGEAYRPALVVAVHPDPEGAAAEALPLLAGRTRRGGLPTAYLCRRHACEEPVTEPAALRRQLGSLRAG
jgi:uncharacterized protein